MFVDTCEEILYMFKDHDMDEFKGNLERNCRSNFHSPTKFSGSEKSCNDITHAQQFN
jgi:hypothetical protein